VEALHCKKEVLKTINLLRTIISQFPTLDKIFYHGSQGDVCMCHAVPKHREFQHLKLLHNKTLKQVQGDGPTSIYKKQITGNSIT
jgi:hypothetical protein